MRCARFLAAASVALLLPLSTADAQRASVRSSAKCTGPGAHQLLEAFVRAFNNGNLPLLDHLFAPEGRFAWYSSNDLGEAGNPAFEAHPPLPLTVQAMSIYSLFEHLPYGHRLARNTFVARGSAYDVQVQFARTITRELRKRADNALRLFHFSSPPGQTPSRSPRC